MRELEYVFYFLIGMMGASLIGALSERFPGLALYAVVVLGLATGSGVVLASLGIVKLIHNRDPLNPGALSLIGLGAVVLLAIAIGTGVVAHALR